MAPYFIFDFNNDFTKQSKIFNSIDLSNYTCRYNRFEIEETLKTVEDLTDSKVNLNPPGFWTYTIYQSATSSLDPTTFGSIIETGKVFVRGDDTETPEVYR